MNKKPSSEGVPATRASARLDRNMDSHQLPLSLWERGKGEGPPGEGMRVRAGQGRGSKPMNEHPPTSL
jgi:hypothetical protein